jgi:hypothetical protein
MKPRFTPRRPRLSPMPRAYVTLTEHPTDIVRLACTKCDRRGQYRKATLIERYGADANLVDLRLILAADCPRVIAEKPVDRCGVIYPDRIGRERAHQNVVSINGKR